MMKYDSYKDSGIAWLGKIPNSWETVRNKHIFREITDCRSTGEETLLTVSHITGITPRSEKNVNMFFAESMAGYKKIKVGDLVINTMWAWMGALGVAKEGGICSPAYNIYRANKGISYDATYFDYLFRTPSFIIEMTRFSKGIVDSRLRLYPKDFYRIDTCLPCLKEQVAIALYLDNKTKVIDEKINLLERKIGYYKELRKSVINETVLRGLDKNVKLKDSEIDWIGKIPEHWKVQRMKDISKIYTGNSISDKDKNKYLDSSLARPYIATKDINGFYRSINYDNGIFVKYNNVKFRIAPQNSILMCIEGGSAGIKKAFIEKEVSFVNKLCCFFSKFTYLENKYLYYFLCSPSYENKFHSKLTGLIGGVSVYELKNMGCILPPLTEQISIVEYLDNKILTIDKIVGNIETQITALKELRKTLINDVVTGKIKVV